MEPLIAAAVASGAVWPSTGVAVAGFRALAASVVVLVLTARGAPLPWLRVGRAVCVVAGAGLLASDFVGVSRDRAEGVEGRGLR